MPPPSLRVVMLIQSYAPKIGGAERQLASLVPLLAERGIDVHVVTRQFDPTLPEQELIGAATVHRVPVRPSKTAASLSYTVGALRLIRRLRPRVLHAYDLLSPTTTALVGRVLHRTPVVVKVLGGGPTGDLAVLRRKPLGRARLAVVRRAVDALVTVSDEIDDQLAASGIRASKRVPIPNGVDLDRFVPLPPVERSRRRQALGLEGPVVVFTGRLEPGKRVDRLMDAWERIRGEATNGTLVIVGTGSMERDLRGRSSPAVRFTGPVDDVLPWLQAADVFVLPSAAEGLSNAMLEAMATGLAVVVTDVGGARDALGDPPAGVLVPPDDAGALVDALRTLLRDNRARDAYGTAARQRVSDAFPLDATADRLAALYRRLDGS